MQTSNDATTTERTTKKLFDRWFPTPKLLAPPAIGIDISDSSIKWLAFEEVKGHKQIRVCGKESLVEGIVVAGVVKDVDALADVLSALTPHFEGYSYAHAALPEEVSYVFSTHVPALTPHNQILRMIEFEFEGRIPIAPSAAVYDYEVVTEHDSDAGIELTVSAFPLDLATAYVDAFEKAGITLLSLELESRSIARAISTGKPDEPITLLVDFGRAQTSFAVLKHGIPIFTSSVDIGGDTMTQALVHTFSMSIEEAEEFKAKKGVAITPGEKSPQREAIVGTVTALADEVARHYHYWDTRRNDKGERVTPVGKVVFVGGGATLNGLCDFVAQRVQAPAKHGNIWQHVASFDDYIPSIDYETSLQYATVAGLALRDFEL